MKSGARLLIVSLVVISAAAVIDTQTDAGQTVRRFAHVLDLTHALDEDTPYIPVPDITFPFKKTSIATIAKNGVAAYRWEIHEHLGTQIDAPSHFFEQGLSLELLPVDRLVVPLVVIDVSARASSNPDTSVTVADIAAWERRHGRIPQDAAVMMASGWDSRIKDAKAFVNADASGAMHFPGFSPEAASFLARSRQVSGIGVDTLSLDPGLDVTYAAHKAWLATGKWGVELVANLRQAPPMGATVFVGAVKVKGATAGRFVLSQLGEESDGPSGGSVISSGDLSMDPLLASHYNWVQRAGGRKGNGERAWQQIQKRRRLHESRSPSTGLTR